MNLEWKVPRDCKGNNMPTCFVALLLGLIAIVGITLWAKLTL